MKRLFASFAFVGALSAAIIAGAAMGSKDALMAHPIESDVYTMRLDYDNGKIVEESGEETLAQAETASRATWNFKHKGLSEFPGNFALFGADSYLLAHEGVNGLTSVSAQVFDGDLQVSFSYSSLDYDGDWTRPIPLSSEPVNAPHGMCYVKIESIAGASVGSITFNYDCSGIESAYKNMKFYVPSDQGYSNFYSWSESGAKLSGDFPGMEMGDEGDFKTFTLLNRESANLIFSGDSGQTDDLSAFGYGNHYYVDGDWYGYDPTHFPSKMYFTSNASYESEWENVYVYAFNSNDDVRVAWPGERLTNYYLNEYDQKVYELPDISSYKKVIFNNGFGDGTNQTVDIDATSLGKCNAFYLVSPSSSSNYEVGAWVNMQEAYESEEPEESSSTESSSEEEALSIPDPLYFTDAAPWGKVYAYAWNDQGNNASWPGEKMSVFKTNEYGQDVYSIEGLSAYENVIFSNGNGTQTIDISTETFQGNNAIYLNGTNDQDKYLVGTWNQSNEELPLAGKNHGLNILHCFDWSVSEIRNNLDNISDAGFNAVQTSPLQPVKDYVYSYQDDHSSWWRFYQPIGLSLAGRDGANQRTNVLVDGDDDLKALTSAARAKGIRVIVDVVANHLADNGAGWFHPSVSDFENQIYQNNNGEVHANIELNDSTVRNITQGRFGGCPDLNTANAHVQNRVYSYLKQLVDDGVTGFRFDAAKHIETKYDADECGSSFWENTLGAIKTYAQDQKGVNLYAYGEILNPAGNTGKRSFSQYIDDAYFDAVTDSMESQNVRNNYSSGYSGGSYQTGVFASHNVIWGESHDEYMGSEGATKNISNSNINDVYVLQAARASASTLYFDRPTSGYRIGTSSYAEEWRGDFIAAANRFHSYLYGANESLRSSSGVTFIERFGAGEGVVAVNKGGATTISLNSVTNGTYTNLITGASYQVSNNQIHLNANESVILFKA